MGSTEMLLRARGSGGRTVSLVFVESPVHLEFMDSENGLSPAAGLTSRHWLKTGIQAGHPRIVRSARDTMIRTHWPMRKTASRYARHSVRADRSSGYSLTVRFLNRSSTAWNEVLC